MAKKLHKVLFDDPARVLRLSKEQLVERFAETCRIEEEIQAQKMAIKDALVEKLEGDGEVIGDYSVVKAKRINFKVDLEKAKELGAVKEAVDSSALKKLYDKGIEIAHTITDYLLIKPVIKSKEK